MNALKLYKFIQGNSIEWHWHEHENDVLVSIQSYEIKDWFGLIKGHGLLDENGIECVMKDGYMCFWMRNICGHSIRRNI
jgi:hypothetical protein